MKKLLHYLYYPAVYAAAIYCYLQGDYFTVMILFAIVTMLAIGLESLINRYRNLVDNILADSKGRADYFE